MPRTEKVEFVLLDDGRGGSDKPLVRAWFPRKGSERVLAFRSNSGNLKLGRITILFGANGSGKSTFALSLYPITAKLPPHLNWILKVAVIGFTTIKWPLPMHIEARVRVNQNNKTWRVAWERTGSDLEHFMSASRIEEVLEVAREVRGKVPCTCRGPPLYGIPGAREARIYGKVCEEESPEVVYSIIEKCVEACGNSAEAPYLSFFYGPHLPLIRNGIMNLAKAFIEGMRQLGKIGDARSYQIEEGYWKEAMGFSSNNKISIKIESSESTFNIVIEKDNEEMPLWSLGDGQRAALAQYMIVKTMKELRKIFADVPFVLVLDTPEAFMHPELMELLASSIVHDLFDNGPNTNNHLIVITQNLEYIIYLLSKYATLKVQNQSNQADIKAYVFERESSNKVVISEVEKPHIHIAYGIDLRLVKR